jgi:hypothetical protein
MDIALVPLIARPFLWLLGITVLPVSVLGILAKLFWRGVGYKLLAASALVLLAVLPIAWAMTKNSVSVQAGKISVQASAFYKYSTPMSAIDWTQARAGKLADMGDFKPRMRTNGIGSPGYNAGWFSLANSKCGFLMVTDPNRVVALPSADGVVLIFNVENPEATLEALREFAVKQDK